MRHSRIPQHHQRTITPHTLCTIHTTTILHMNSLSDNLKMSEVTHLGLGNDYANCYKYMTGYDALLLKSVLWEKIYLGGMLLKQSKIIF